MKELISVMEEIRDLLSRIDEKLDDIRGNGLYSMEDVCRKLNEIETIRGNGLNSLDDICNKLDDIKLEIEFK